jgi:hypothetical protein
VRQTYNAILHGDRLEWVGDRPTLDPDRPIAVRITLDSAPVTDPDVGRRMANILRELAKTNPFRDIDDPVAWQREIREDRPLPGREP